MKHVRLPGTEVAQQVAGKMGARASAPAVDDDLFGRIDAGVSENLLDLRLRNEVLAVRIPQLACSFANADRARNVSVAEIRFGTDIPDLRLALDCLPDERCIDDDRCTRRSVRQHQDKRNKDPA
ncbi:MAG: hypothetical protein WCF44_08615 [Candidatus Methylophosphatis roskildensis]